MRVAAALALIVVAGLGLRLGYAVEGTTEVLDSASYGRIATGVYERGEFEQVGPGTPAHAQPATNYTPGLPLLIAGIYEISGGVHPQLARIVLALLASLAMPISFLIGRRLSGPVAGLIGAGVVAIYPALLEYGGMFMTEPLGATLVSGSILAVLWALDREQLWSWLVPGAYLGLTAMVRPEYLMISVALAVVVGAIVWRREGWRASLWPPLVLLAALVLVIAPWTVRNLTVLDRFVPLSTGGGQTLFTGSYRPSGGDPQAVGSEVLRRHPGILAQIRARNRVSGEGPESVTMERVLALLAARRHPGMSSDAALARMGRERYENQLREDPLGLAAYLLGKAGRIWATGPRAVMHEPQWIAFQALLLAFALVGLATLAIGRRTEVLVIGIVLLAATAVGAVLVASPRRILVLIPVVSALAGAGVMALRGRMIDLRQSRAGVGDTGFL